MANRRKFSEDDALTLVLGGLIRGPPHIRPWPPLRSNPKYLLQASGQFPTSGLRTGKVPVVKTLKTASKIWNEFSDVRLLRLRS